MARKRQSLTPDVSVGKGYAMLGWCLEFGIGNHAACWGETEFTVCSCKCHKRKEKK